MTGIQTQGQTAVAVSEPNSGAQAIEAKDILIPKLLLMQPISELVTDGTVQAGSLVRSTDKTVVSKKDASLEFIPLQFFKMWVIIKKKPGDTRGEFVGIEAYTPENCNAPRGWRDDGVSFERNENLCFYGLLPSDIAKEKKAFEKFKKTGELPDSDDSLLPCLLAFQRTSKKAGQVITSHFAKLDDFSARMGQPIPRYISVFNISAELTKDDKGTYYVFKVEKGRKTTDAEGEACAGWTNILSKVKADVDHSDLETPRQKPADEPETIEHGGRTF